LGWALGELRGEPSELGLLVGELHLELLGVDALGRGHVDASAEQLELELDLLIGVEEPLVVRGELVGTSVLGGERGLEHVDARP